jgi:hypothetical protein
MNQNGRSTVEVDNGADTHTRSAMKAARWLCAGHLHFRVITGQTLDGLAKLKALVLSNVHHLGEDEAEMIRKWVQRGGMLYASGATSLINERGQLQADFMLADVFGVSLVKADWSSREHYLAPTEAGKAPLSDWTTKYPADLNCLGMTVRALQSATVLATRTLPWESPNHRAFSSIHSNPPWQATDLPELVSNQYGQGRAIYSASLLEESENLKDSFLALICLLNQDFAFEIEAHPAVEATLFHQANRKRYVLSLVNFQHDLPNIPIDGIRIRLHLPQRVRAVTLLPSKQKIAVMRSARRVEFAIPRLQTLCMLAIHVED